jgi:positive phototaxis protein PixI
MTNLTINNLDWLTLEPPSPDTRQRLLRFPLGKVGSVLLPLEQIAEVLRLDGVDILPVPEMPNCVLGISNWRGEMLWLVDLNHLMGDEPLSGIGQLSASPTAIVIEVEEECLGLVVSSVDDIELHELERLQPATPGLFPAKLLLFIRGYLPGNQGVVLNAAAIAKCPLWSR